MHLFTYLPSLLLLPFALVQADTNSSIAALESQISPCAAQCATTEITKYGVCAVTDFVCQCQHFSDLKALVGPCLQNNSTCSPAEIKTFLTNSEQVCVVLGINVNSTSNASTSSGAPTGTASMTMTGSPSASVTATQQSGAASVMDVNMVMGSSFAIIGAGLLAVLL